MPAATLVPKDLEAKDELIDSGFNTVKEAAAFLRLSVPTVYRMVDAREIESATFGKSVRIPTKALRDYAKRNLG